MSALESEVKDLRARVRHSEHDAAAARVLAGGADRDIKQTIAEICGRLDAAAAGQQQIVGLLTTLIDRQDDH